VYLAERQSIEKAVEIAREIRTRERFNKIDFYDPYPYQKNFHDTGGSANQRLLMAANRIGKSYCGAAELALHVTGLYHSYNTSLLVVLYRAVIGSIPLAGLERP